MGEPNDRLRAARQRVESPYSTGQALSRAELADLVNQQVYAESGRVIELSANYIGKLERGQIRWLQSDYLVLSSMARQAIWCGDPDSGLTLTELAMVRADRLTPTERAMLFSARARALGKLRRVQETASTIGMADEQFANSSPDNDPAWMAYYDAAQHSGDTGHALYELAVCGHFVSDARERLSAAVARHSAAYVRSRAISGIKLACLTMVTGDPLDAASLGSRALGDAGKIRSRRAVDDLRELRALAEPHSRLTEVGELCSRIGIVVATA
jgi:hypothetical protein